MKIRIEITKGPDSGREFVLGSNEQLTIGRGDESEIRMTDPLISREHCEIKCDGKQLLLRDLESTNKTFLIQGSSIEPIAPRKDYQVTHGNSFFVGPESRFTATYLPSIPASLQGTIAKPGSEREPPDNSGGNSARGNFSMSIEAQQGSDPRNSSIFNLLGDFPQQAKSLDTGIQSNAHPTESGKPNVDAQGAPPSQGSQFYDSKSIASPQDQGTGGRKQVVEPVSSEPSRHAEAPQESPIREPDTEKKVPSAFCGSVDPQEHSPSVPSPTSFDSPPPASSYEDASIAPPHLQGIGQTREQVEEVNDESLRSTPKIDDPKGGRPASKSAPTLKATGSPDAFSSSAIHKSIAVPGQVYKMRKPSDTRAATNPPQDTSVFASSVPLEPPLQSVPVAAPGEDQLTPESSDHQSNSAQQNGLHFHTGTDLAQLDGLIAEIAQKAKPIYCVDFSRLEIEPPTEDSPPESPSGESGVAKAQGPDKVNDSAFEFDDDVESQPKGDSRASVAKLIGTPLFDFLPEGHKQNGPILLTQSELNLSLSDAWRHDAIVVFFGPDPNATTEHLKKLLHTNIQTGKQFKGMFGFCWPSVLHTLFESQGKDQVKRVFGDAISHVLLEDPQQRYDWNLVALNDQANSLQSLGNNR